MPKQTPQRSIYFYSDQKENEGFKSNKRKATNSLDEAGRKPPVNGSRPTWDNSEITQKLLQDMDAGYLSNSSTDSCNSIPEITPALLNKDEGSARSVPGAARVLLDSQGDNITSASDESDCSIYLTATPSMKSVDSAKKSLHLNINKNKLARTQKTDTSAFDPFSLLSDEMLLSIFRLLPKFVLAKCARVCKKWSRLVLDESLWKRINLACKSLNSGVLGHVMNRGVWALRLAKAEIKGPIYTVPTSPRLSKLQYLDLSSAGATPDILEELFTYCKDLRKLSLENLVVNDEVCSLLGENKDLTVLDLATCRGVTVKGLIPILSNCKHLESLNLGWTNLHHRCIVYLCLCAPVSLQRLNISGFRENITDEDVLQLGKSCPYLRQLDLSDSTSLSKHSIDYIVQHLPHLEHLSLSRCYNIPPGSISGLSEMSSLLAVNVFGMLRDGPLEALMAEMPDIDVNAYRFSDISRPTIGHRRTSIWGIRVRDTAVWQ